MAICGALVVSTCAFVVWRISPAQIGDRYLRCALAAMVVLIGVTGTEMLGNVVNSIWFITFSCFWLLLWRPRGLAAAALAGTALLLGAVSSAAAMFLAPLWLVRAAVVSDRRDLLIVAGFAIGVVLQLGVSHDQIGGAEGDPSGLFLDARHWDFNLVGAYAQRVIGGSIAGQGVDGLLWRTVGWPFVAVLAIGLVAVVYRSLGLPRTRVIVPLTIAISLVMFLAAGYLRWGAGGIKLFWPEDVSTTLGSRYVVTPALLLLSAILIQVDAELAAGRWRERAAPIRTVALGVIVGCALISFRIAPVLENRAPAWPHAVDDARQACAAGGLERVDVVTTETRYGRSALAIDCDELR
jgi:hypothetical protein